MEYFAGLDVSLRSCAICVVDAKGKVVLEKDLLCEVDAIADCLNSCGHLPHAHVETTSAASYMALTSEAAE
jgi:hypothetical protein